MYLVWNFMISTPYSCKSLSCNSWWGFKVLTEARTEWQRRPAWCRGPQQGPKLPPGGRTVLAAELCRAAGLVPGTASGSSPCFEPELPLHSPQASLSYFSSCKVLGSKKKCSLTPWRGLPSANGTAWVPSGVCSRCWPSQEDSETGRWMETLRQ